MQIIPSTKTVRIPYAGFKIRTVYKTPGQISTARSSDIGNTNTWGDYLSLKTANNESSDSISV